MPTLRVSDPTAVATRCQIESPADDSEAVAGAGASPDQSEQRLGVSQKYIPPVLLLRVVENVREIMLTEIIPKLTRVQVLIYA